MILLLGDSITEFGGQDGGWQELLTRDYIRKADIINRGFGGYNSRWGTFLVDDIFTSFGSSRIKLATVCFGANDAAAPELSAGYLSVPVEEYSANLRAIISKLKSKGVERIIVMSPPPVDDTNPRYKDGSRSTERVKPYADAAVAVARDLGLPFVDLFNKIQMEHGWRKKIMTYDGLHMSREGNRFIHDNLQWVVSDSYSEMQPSHLPLHFPLYSKVDAEHPEETFDSLYGYKVDRGLPRDASLPAAVHSETADAPSKVAGPAVPSSAAEGKGAGGGKGEDEKTDDVISSSGDVLEAGKGLKARRMLAK